MVELRPQSPGRHVDISRVGKKSLLLRIPKGIGEELEPEDESVSASKSFQVKHSQEQTGALGGVNRFLSISM